MPLPVSTSTTMIWDRAGGDGSSSSHQPNSLEHVYWDTWGLEPPTNLIQHSLSSIPTPVNSCFSSAGFLTPTDHSASAHQIFGLLWSIFCSQASKHPRRLGWYSWFAYSICGLTIVLLQHVSIACYAKHCISYRKFCPTVCHTLVSSQNDFSYDHGVFTGG